MAQAAIQDGLALFRFVDAVADHRQRQHQTIEAASRPDRRAPGLTKK
jgi:hypothetical protein